MRMRKTVCCVAAALAGCAGSTPTRETTVGYAIYDINRPCDDALIRKLGAIPHTIRFRVAETPRSLQLA